MKNSETWKGLRSCIRRIILKPLTGIIVGALIVFRIGPPQFLEQPLWAQASVGSPPLRTYGKPKLGLYFSTPLRLAQPFRHVSGYPTAEYWTEDNRLWVYNASLRNRNKLDKKAVDTFLARFFFPSELGKLKEEKHAMGRVLSGPVTIHGEAILVKALFVHKDGFFHLLTFFARPSATWSSVQATKQLSALLQSVKLNPNFRPF